MTTPKPETQKSNVRNPNNPAYEADRDNRIRQGHTNVPAPPVAPSQSSGSEQVKK